MSGNKNKHQQKLTNGDQFLHNSFTCNNKSIISLCSACYPFYYTLVSPVTPFITPLFHLLHSLLHIFVTHMYAAPCYIYATPLDTPLVTPLNFFCYFCHTFVAPLVTPLLHPFETHLVTPLITLTMPLW